MSKIPRTQKEKRRFWLSHLDTWRESSLSMAAYARYVGISSKSPGYCMARSGASRCRRQAPSGPGLLPVSVTATVPEAPESPARDDAGLSLVTHQG